MHFMVQIVGNADLVAAAKAEDLKALMGAFMAYTQAMQAAGVYVHGSPLKPAPTAKTLRVKDGKTQVLDGPYAESKEQLGGYYVLNVPGLDQALEWAAKNPGLAYGAIEVRQLEVIPGFNDRAG